MRTHVYVCDSIICAGRPVAAICHGAWMFCSCKILKDKKRFREAIIQIKSALSYYPYHAKQWLELSHLYSRSGAFLDAKKSARNFVKYRPGEQ